jgi:hypothetical protein
MDISDKQQLDENEALVEAALRHLISEYERQKFYQALQAWKNQERDYQVLYWVYYSEWK